MSCEIRTVASIAEIDKIQKWLFPLDDKHGGDTWLQSSIISIAPGGDMIAIANERKIVTLIPIWDNQSSTFVFHLCHSGTIHDYDKVKALITLSLIDQSDNIWTCIIAGFDSGHVRFYDINCDIVFEKQFHAENITTMYYKPQKYHKHNSRNAYPEEIYIQYQSVICVINGPQLISILLGYRNGTSDFNPDGLVPKKWGFQEQSVINDSVVVGLNYSNTFDHLLTASTCGGFNTKFGSQAPRSTVVVGAGSKPFLGYHYSIEGENHPALSDVAKAVAIKFKSTLPTWLVGSKSPQEKQISFAAQPADDMGCRFGLSDLRRAATNIILSPDRRLAAVSDTLGRILLVDSLKGVVLRIFKGYREAQCSFVQVSDERKSKPRTIFKAAYFLIVYSSKKGTIEFFATQHGSRIAIFSASKFSRLLYVNQGYNTMLKNKNVCQQVSFLVDNDGLIKEIDIPFHFTLSEKNKKRARDVHLYRKFKHLIALNPVDGSQALNICCEIETIEAKSQLVDLILKNKNIPAEVSLSCVQYFVENLDDEEGANLKMLGQKIVKLMHLFIFLTGKEEDNENVELNEKFSEQNIKDMAILQKFFTLSFRKNIPDTRVNFFEKVTAAEFLSVFTYSTETSISVNYTEEEMSYRAADLIYRPYINGTANNFNKLYDELKKSTISTRSLFSLLLNYWSHLVFDINPELEEKVNRLSILLKAIVKVSPQEIDVRDYEEKSNFWSFMRRILIKSPKPFQALMAAVLCRNIAQECIRSNELKDSPPAPDDIEILTQEDIEWSILIGKLEDVSWLDIILSSKPEAVNCPLPKLKFEKIDISLEHILERGKGIVGELVARWLASIGLNPETLVIMDKVGKDQEDDAFFYEYHKPFLAEKVLEQLKEVKQQFPFSLQDNCILTSMCWEYAIAWQKDMQNLKLLESAIICLNKIHNAHVKQGLFQLMWNTNLKIVTENICKLINKVGKLPKERLCIQDTGLTDSQTKTFLNISTDFLEQFIHAVNTCYVVPIQELRFENIWDQKDISLIETAMRQKEVNFDLLSVHYQLSCVFNMLTTWGVKFSKPINNLFEASVVNLFFTDFQRQVQISNRSDSQLNSSRTKFLMKIIQASLESVTVDDAGEIFAATHDAWTAKCITLGHLWNMDVDILRRFQVVQLYCHGYDSIGAELIGAVNERSELGRLLLVVCAKRLSLWLDVEPNYAQNMTALSTALARYMRELKCEWCVQMPLKDITALAKKILTCIKEGERDYRMATMLFDACINLESFK